jgi:hypothetical protein
MLQKKQFKKRSVMDRRSFLDRRILNLGPLYPGKERREIEERRIGWEDRVGWQPTNQWDSFFESTDLTSSEKPEWN